MAVSFKSPFAPQKCDGQSHFRGAKGDNVSAVFVAESEALAQVLCNLARPFLVFLGLHAPIERRASLVHSSFNR